MKKAIFCLVLFISISSICRVQAENTSRQVDSLKMLLKIAPNDTIRINIMNELSAYLGDFDKFEEAYDYGNQAKALSEKMHYRQGVASALRKIGVNLIQQGEYARSLEYLLQSLKINDSLKNDREIFMLDNNIGTVYCLRKDYAIGLDYFFKSRQYKNDAITTDNLGWATANIGWAFMQQEKYMSSIDYYKKALKLYTESSDKNGVASMLNNIGTAYEYIGKNDKALEYYLQSLKIKMEIEDNPGIVDALAGIGDIKYKMGKNKIAIEYENKSLLLARKIGYMISVQQTEQKLSDIYGSIGDKSNAYDHYRKYISVRDSLYNEQETKKSVRAEMNFEFLKKQDMEKFAQDKKDAETMQEKKRQEIIIYAVSVGLFLVFLLAVFIFRGYKQKQKANKDLEYKNNTIEEQKKIVEEKNKDITDSIQYAKRIQDAMLPPDSYIREVMPEHLLFFEPKSIVSGDFYFVTEKDEKTIWATCDATGHGASASLLTMLGSNILSGIVKDGETIPSKILDRLNQHINESLHKTGDDSIRDGMDVTICSLDKNSMTLSFAGANNPLWIIRNNEIIEYKADKMPIGQMYKNASYTNNEIKLQHGDSIYSFSDGICDLHSVDNKKFMKKRLRELLLSIRDKKMSEQKAIISETLKKWQGAADQVDDMLLIGVRI